MDSFCYKDTKRIIHHGAVSKFGQGIRLKLLLIEVQYPLINRLRLTTQLTEIYEDKHVELEKEWNTDQAKSNSIRLSNEALI